ncbi:hypothetical protein [Ornithinimicrobium sp. LYQ103]|uniref:hypothetical protein n=1 Tax=Ornithinimicrobium sp. LYQ103 TaxID=3378796 RepID=UPI00385382CF
MNIGHDSSRPLNISNVTGGTSRSDDGYLQAWVEFDVDEEPWEQYQQELRAAGVPGFGGMSITFMQPLDGEEMPNGLVLVSGDAHHYTDAEIRAAAVILRSLDPSAAGQQMYQLAAIPELRVVFEMALEFVMGIGPSLTAAALYDAAKSLFRPGRINTFDLSFKESKNGTRSLKVSIKVGTEEELHAALDRLPKVLESGARGTFTNRDSGYVRVDDEPAATIEKQAETLEIEGPDGLDTGEDPEAPTDE